MRSPAWTEVATYAPPVERLVLLWIRHEERVVTGTLLRDVDGMLWGRATRREDGTEAVRIEPDLCPTHWCDLPGAPEVSLIRRGSLNTL